jgi:hypothetical protein
MTKYYEGSLYLNYYLDGLAGIVGISLAHSLYQWMKMRWAFIFSLSFTILFCLLMFLFQERHISPRFITSLGAAESPYPADSIEDQDFNLKTLIPPVVFIAKVFINITFLNVYQISFNEDIIFPFYKRATATGIGNFVGRTLTIFAPLVAEIPKPVPAIFLLAINGIALIASIFLPSRQ